MKNKSTKNIKDPDVMLSARVPKSRVKKLKHYLLQKDKNIVQWVKEKIDEIPDEESHRAYHRKAG